MHGTMNTATSSAMLYTVEPPLSVAEFTSAAPSDLQVKIAVLLYVSCAMVLRYQVRFREPSKIFATFVRHSVIVLSSIALLLRYFADCSLTHLRVDCDHRGPTQHCWPARCCANPATVRAAAVSTDRAAGSQTGDDRFPVAELLPLRQRRCVQGVQHRCRALNCETRKRVAFVSHFCVIRDALPLCVIHLPNLSV
jgi:hypothetical protein